MSEQTLQPPLDKPCEMQVKKVEHVKTLAEKDGAIPHVVKLGLIAPNDWKGWAELYVPKPEMIPEEGKTRTIGLKMDPQYGLKAWLPKKGGGGGNRGGGRPADPKAEAYRQAAIVHQHSQTLALEVLRTMEFAASNVDQFAEELNRIACKLTLQVQEVGEEARGSA